MMSTTTSNGPALDEQRQAQLSIPLRRVLGAYLAEARYETLAALRSPALAVPFLVVPIAAYVVFGILMMGDAIAEVEDRPGLSNYFFSGFMVLAVALCGLFGGMTIATEREAGLLKLKRALPMPTAAHLVGKTTMSTLFAIGASGGVLAAAMLAGTTTLSTTAMLTIWAVMAAGTFPFCALGLFVGSLASGSAAPAYGNLLFLPMLWLSGLFIPLPEFLRPWVVIWPSFHLNQVAAAAGGIEDFVFIPTQMAISVLAGITVLFGGLAVRRLARVG